ncbi:Fc.00g052470.m01.CDS01 [Cosmosporella sp. VM-42]
MMHPLFGVQQAGSLPVPYPHDSMLDDLSRQMALSQASRRLSRSSNSQRSGNAMRVAKPTSANNSPRSSALMGRRRTLMNDGNAQRRQQQVLEQVSMYYGTENQQTVKRSERPVSWHPSSYGQQLQHQTQQQYYSLPTPNMYADQQYPQFSPMMASYSCNTSPSSSFSPLALPFQSVDTFQYLPTEERLFTQQPPPIYHSTNGGQYVQEGFSTSEENVAEDGSSNGWDWNTFIMHGYSTTTPPTPETFPQAQLSQPAMSDESLSYEALEEPEEEGEILVGMGLYDTPDKYEEDPQLDNYRSTVSSLLGSTLHSQEPRGKGLKLEETWEPPKSEDEDEEEEESSEDDSN